MDFRHLIVTCLFSKLRLPFDNQKVKENYAIFSKKFRHITTHRRDDTPFTYSEKPSHKLPGVLSSTFS